MVLQERMPSELFDATQGTPGCPGLCPPRGAVSSLSFPPACCSRGWAMEKEPGRAGREPSRQLHPEGLQPGISGGASRASITWGFSRGAAGIARPGISNRGVLRGWGCSSAFSEVVAMYGLRVASLTLISVQLIDCQLITCH